MAEQQLRTGRRITLVWLHAVFAAAGVTAALTPDSLSSESAERTANGLLLMTGLASALGFMWFCTADARLVGKSLLRLAKIGIVVCWPIGVPIYAVWARGIIRGLALVLLHGFLLLVTCLGTAILTILVY